MRLVERELDHAEHVSFRSGFSGPEFKLARTLVDEHFYALDGCDAAGVSFLKKRSLERVVDQVEDQARFPFFGFERERVVVAGHAAGRGVDEHVKL
jgi:hypothetical protein